jgi:choice-of-anchor C domain-containing protein
MKLRYVLAAGAAALLVAASPRAMASNLISDGNFDSPSAGSGYTTYSLGQSIGAWTVTTGTVNPHTDGASVDLIGGYWQAPAGGGSVDLDGAYQASGIMQTFATTAGANYLLTFSLSGNPDGGPGPKDLLVTVGNASSQFTFVTGANSHDNMDYVAESVAFQATGTSTTLTFASEDVANSAFGPVIGNVSVSAVPLPGALTLFGAGLVGLGAFGWRKGRRNAA